MIETIKGSSRNCFLHRCDPPLRTVATGELEDSRECAEVSRKIFKTLKQTYRQQNHTSEVIGQRFLGNESHVEHFKLLERATTSILIGARNAIYNISLHDLTEIVDQDLTVMEDSGKDSRRSADISSADDSMQFSYFRRIAG
ncbi:Semaphorin-1A [Harpegnathos saltator]|uniref:Semaphorin-1A n=1 Tax=Harpegnathos saltator TaxID=610380 RepID=E2BU81_HARSA|nr:Semaphorin-1A [Harpegnathos saltator]